MTIEEKVKEIVSEELQVNPEEVQADAALVDDLCADSMDMQVIVMRMEEEFNIEIPDEDIEPFRTVGDIINYLERRTIY